MNFVIYEAYFSPAHLLDVHDPQLMCDSAGVAGSKR